MHLAGAGRGAILPRIRPAFRFLFAVSVRIHVITTGGTIDKVYFDAKSEYEVGEPQVLEIFREAGVAFEFTIESVVRKDSLELTEADREHIRERAATCGCDRILVTHGTDTMRETALALRGLPGKTIVLTGAMHPARFRSSDAVFNVGTAIGAVQCLPPGVYLAINGRIFDPARVRKNRERQRFEDAP
jgi:L-asparaginase